MTDIPILTKEVIEERRKERFIKSREQYHLTKGFPSWFVLGGIFISLLSVVLYLLYYWLIAS